MANDLIMKMTRVKQQKSKRQVLKDIGEPP